MNVMQINSGSYIAANEVRGSHIEIWNEEVKAKVSPMYVPNTSGAWCSGSCRVDCISRTPGLSPCRASLPFGTQITGFVTPVSERSC